MVEAIEREVDLAERYRQCVKDAVAADEAIDAGAGIFAAGDVHAWLQRLSRDGKAGRPKPWGK